MERILSKTKIGNKIVNLHESDMPRSATFEHDDLGHECVLLPCDSVQDQHTGMWIRKPNTGCTVKFKGGKLLVSNKALFDLVIGSSAYKNNNIRIDPEDSTGFWRGAGVLKVEQRPVLVAQRPVNPASVDISKIKPVEIDEVVEPVLRG